jgi:ATP-dependent DNA helicase RecG
MNDANSDMAPAQSVGPDVSLLRMPVSRVPGVGQFRADQLLKLGIRTVVDLMFLFPRTYEDLTKLSRVCQLHNGAKASIPGTICEVELREFGEGKSILGVLLNDGADYLRAVWFNQPFMTARFQVGQNCVFTGVPKKRGGRWEMNHPEFVFHADEAEPAGMLAVYPLTEGIGQKQMRAMVLSAVEHFGGALEEAFSDSLLERFGLIGMEQALADVHRPVDRERLARARRRFVFQELFIMQLAMARRRHLLSVDLAPTLPISAKIRSRILRRFPFELTESQLTVCEEIAADMSRQRPMNRLLQGDVGSGKTAVATFAMLLAVAHGYQATLMAPTEVLARQHARSIGSLLQGSAVRIDTMLGSDTPKQREDLLGRLAANEVDILIGTQAITHAVKSEKLNLERLGIVIVDEQHKFGVRQRSLMKQAGAAPHCLVMTATPIPRTITMSMFGDLDVSQLTGSPHQRKLHTYQGTDETKDRWWDFFAKKIREGRQGFVIAPLVDAPVDAAPVDAGPVDELPGEPADTANADTSKTEVSKTEVSKTEVSKTEVSKKSPQSVEEIFEELAADRLEAFRVDILHGRMSSQEKEDCMLRFSSGETQVLVATSIVEVGIDVPNACVMTIVSANRFGLAQLHQLRGRVGRGSFPGYVCAFPDNQEEVAAARLAAFCRSTDGFELAEEDFRLRGPGEIMGTRQHGLPPLRIADLIRDQDSLEEARSEARWLIDRDPDLSAPEHAKLARLVNAQYGAALDLGDVG